ncbi:MAG: mechanosensitive ion channel family protein [Dehalococcoidia bacterium]
MSDIDWDRIIEWLLTHGLRIVLILLLAVIADLALRLAVPHIIRPAVTRQMAGKPEEEIEQRIHTLVTVLRGSGRFIIVAWALFTILPELGVNVTPILASVGIAGIALGFGAQSLVKDVISGLFILVENQYSKGDVVTVAGISGLVEDVGLRRTVLRDLDGIVHHVPNGQIAVASNFTQEWSRVNMNVSVAYGEDLDKVFEVINRVGRELAADAEFGPLIIKPPQVLRVDAFEESGIAIKILGDTEPIRQWDVMGELRKRLKKAFDEEGIEIPFPHRVLVTKGAKATGV